jgi:hypothetical protein
MGKATVTVQMSADPNVGPNIGWFEGGEQEAPVEGGAHLAGAAGPGR